MPATSVSSHTDLVALGQNIEELTLDSDQVAGGLTAGAPSPLTTPSRADASLVLKVNL